MHTQCPKCRTVFNVTEQILAVKAGLVRCGDCENVFNATWHLVDDTGVDDPVGAPADNPFLPKAGHVRPDDDAPTWSLSDAVDRPGTRPENEDEDEDDTATDDDSQPTWPQFQPAREDLADDEDHDDEVGDDDDVDDDVFIRPHRLDAGRDAPAHPAAAGDDDEDSEISDEEIRRTLRLDDAFEEDGVDGEEADRAMPGPRAPAEPDVERPRGPGGERIEPRLTGSPPGLSVSADDALLPRRTAPRSPVERSPLKRRPAIALKAPPRPRAARPAGPAEGEGARGQAAADEANVHWVSLPDGQGPGTRILWGVGVVLLLAAIVLQVRFTLVDELYAIPGTRPYVSLFCGFAGCTAPQRSEPGAIEIAQTRVDLHPEVPGAIRINVNLINRAQFAQPYPALQLTLSDKDGRIVGRRTYTPDDYLAGKPEALLDPGILAVAALNLAHPNEIAVGFETRVVAAAP